MPLVCDIQVIQGDAVRRIGDGASLWEKTFRTTDRWIAGEAILMFMVAGLTATESAVDVKINNKKVGSISNYHGAPSSHWFTQIIDIGVGILKDGDNEIQIEAVSWPGAKPGNVFDDFYVKDVVCFFQQFG